MTGTIELPNDCVSEHFDYFVISGHGRLSWVIDGFGSWFSFFFTMKIFVSRHRNVRGTNLVGFFFLGSIVPWFV